MSKIGNMIKFARKKKNFTQKSLQKKIVNLGYKSVTDGYISRIENGNRIPSVAKIRCIARVLDLDQEKMLDTAKNIKIKKIKEKFKNEVGNGKKN